MEPIEGEDKKSTYRRLFSESLDVMVTNISDRFSDMPKLKFLSMLDHKQFTKFSAEFPANAMNCLAENYGARFDFARLRSELVAVYSDPEFSRNVCDLHDYIRTQELDDVFPETYKLSKLILTIPATSSSTERSFSALKRIKNYLRNTQGQERMSSLSLLNIENRFLDKLMSKETFFDEVIDIFAGKTRRIDLQYKS
jgi:hypothetical protein